jgi:hypothetical protein
VLEVVGTIAFAGIHTSRSKRITKKRKELLKKRFFLSFIDITC